MKEALDKEGLKPHLMVQPVGYHTPEVGRRGHTDLPEFPFGKFPASSRFLDTMQGPREAVY